MDIDYSLNAIEIKKTGFFYKEERKVQYSEFKKPTDSARWNKSVRMMMKHLYTYANEASKTTHNFYLRVISLKMEEGEFTSDVPKAQLTKEELQGLRTGEVTPKILLGIKTKEITRKKIRDIIVRGVVEDMGWTLPEDSDDDHPTDKQLSECKSISASGIGNKETQV